VSFERQVSSTKDALLLLMDICVFNLGFLAGAGFSKAN